jgi:alkanesulfonate monooxygenase SsuD/methylene tetrahydromethanopterin reductase-like flavin-dependent oxidoreductase (luciferase family)
LPKPYVIVGAGIYAADTDEEARRLFSSAQLQTLNLIRGNPTKLQPPNEKLDQLWTAHERAAIEHRTKYAVVGSPEIMRQRFREILEETRADELIVTAQIFDHAARLRSFEIGAEILRNISAA